MYIVVQKRPPVKQWGWFPIKNVHIFTIDDDFKGSHIGFGKANSFIMHRKAG
jgi:hypothetical protein